MSPLPADELSALADAALTPPPGCQAAELRVERVRSQVVRLHDAQPETTADGTDFGMGVRVVHDGAVGFAASVDVRPDEAAHLVAQAREMARVTSQAGGGRVELAPEPSHGEVTWTSAFDVDPSERPGGRQDRPAGRMEPAPRRARGRRPHQRVAPRRHRADLSGRPQRHPCHPAPGAPPVPARGVGALRVRLRDHAHDRPAGRAGLGVPDGSGLGRELGLGRRGGPPSPSCWPRSWPHPPSRPAPTTSWSTRPTCG